MASIGRRRAAGAAAAVASFADVPTEVLQHILGFLETCRDRCALAAPSPAARRRSPPLPRPPPTAQPFPCRPTLPLPRQRAALVCRRWFDCVHSCELCGDVLASRAPGSLIRWLRRHGHHVHSLRLSAVGKDGYLNFEEGMLLGCCLATCSGLPRSRSLHIDSGSLVARHGWHRCAACRSCRCVRTTTRCTSGTAWSTSAG